MIAALITTLFFAATAVCATQATRLYSPVRANVYRLLIATALLLLWAAFAGDWLTAPARIHFLAAGAIGFGLGGFFMFQAFPRIGSTLSLLVVECAAALSAAAFSWALLGASITPPQGLFALLSLGGVCLAFAPYRLPEASRGVLLLGAAFAAIASIAQGFSFTLSKKAFALLAESGISGDPMVAASWRLLGGLAIAVLIFVTVRWGLRTEKPPANPPQDRRFQLWIVANALAGPVLGVSCMLWAIREVGNPGLVQAVVATATFFTVPAARRLEKRSLTINYFLGATLSIVGTAGLLTIHLLAHSSNPTPP